MLGVPVKPYRISLLDIDYVAVKAPMFSFTRLRGADPTLGTHQHCTLLDVMGAVAQCTRMYVTCRMLAGGHKAKRTCCTLMLDSLFPRKA